MFLVPRKLHDASKWPHCGETVKPDPCCSSQGHSRRVGANVEVGDENMESHTVLQARAPHFCCCQMSWLVVVQRVQMSQFEMPSVPQGEWVRVEWSRCPGSMAQCARDSGSFATNLSRLEPCKDRKELSAGVGRRHLVLVRKALLLTD